MMMNKILISCLLLVASVLGACGGIVRPSENIVSRTLTLGDFDKIDTRIVKVRYSVGAPGDATLSAPDNVIDNVVVEVRDGELFATLKNNVGYSGEMEITLVVQSSALREVECAAAGSVTVLTDLTVSGEFSADISSAGLLKVGTLHCNKADMEVSSAANITIDSLKVADKADLEASSAASISVGSISGLRLDADASSAASITVAGGRVNKVDLSSSSGAQVKVGAAFGTGKAEASSGGSVRTNTRNLSDIDSSSGGSVRGL